MTSFNLSSISFDPSVLKTGSGFLDTYAKPLIDGFRVGSIGDGDNVLLAKADQQAPSAPVLPPPPSAQTPPIVANPNSATTGTPPIAPAATPSVLNPASSFGVSDELWNGLTPEQKTNAISSIISTTIQKNSADKSNEVNMNAYERIFDKVNQSQRELNRENQANQMAAFYATRNQQSFNKMMQAVASRPVNQIPITSFSPQVQTGVVYKLGPTIGGGTSA